MNLISHKDMLKEKYNLIAATEKDARDIFQKLESFENQGFYGYNDKNEISQFFSKKLVNIICKQFKVICFTKADRGNSDIYIYKDGKYQKNDILTKFVYGKLSEVDSRRIRNYRETIDDLALQSYVHPNEINNDENIINFKNGILDLKKKELLPHSHEFLATIQIKANYSEFTNNAVLSQRFEKSQFKQYLLSSFNNDLIPTIQEVFGYCLSSYTKAQKFFVLLGEGKNGKSVLLNVLSSLFDDEFISGVDLKDISKPEFAARLHNKAVNICADISSEYIPSTSIIKGLTGEDKAGIEVKPLYSNPFKLHNKAKLIFSGNDIPSSNDKTFAFIRRLLIIPCSRIIEEKNRIENLSEIIINGELDIVASWAIEGLMRLITNKFRFSETQEIKEASEEYRKSNNSVEAFINDYCYIDSNNEYAFIPKREFTDIYNMFCESENSKPLGAKNINATMKQKGIFEKFHTLHPGRYWDKISWRETVVEFRSLNSLRGHKKMERDIRKENLMVCRTEEEIKEGLQQLGIGDE